MPKVNGWVEQRHGWSRRVGRVGWLSVYWAGDAYRAMAFDNRLTASFKTEEEARAACDKMAEKLLRHALAGLTGEQ